MRRGLEPRPPWRRTGGAAVAGVLLLASWAAAQSSDPPPVTTAMDLLGGAPATVDGDVIQAGCSGCGAGGGVLGSPPVGPVGGSGGCSTCGGAGRSPCSPGHKPCCPCDADTWAGRFCCCLYECICCVDPCYEPRWIPIADAAFFVESARPITQQRLRWDYGPDVQFPDRSEFFWPRERVLGTPNVIDKGPSIPFIPVFRPGKVPTTQPLYQGEIRTNYNDISVYTEVASSFLSFFTEIPYRSLDPELAAHAAGFGDINLGTKSLLYDCELLQLTFQFKTYLPSGNFLKGLGTGHVSLEPSVILNINCGPDSYIQSQLAEWIPLGGDPDYSGAVLHYHVSYNHVLCRPIGDVPLIGTFEASGWSFQDGAYTDPVNGPYQKSSGYTYFSIGPGFRLVVCDKIDFGVGALFSISDHHFADPLVRSEVRWRF